MSRIIKYFFIFIFFTTINSLSAQKSDEAVKSDYNSGFIIGFSYGLNFSGGDLNDRFGNNFKIDITPTYYFNNSNISIGIEGSYLFGNNVKESVLSNLLTYDDQIISIDKSLSSLSVSERGFLFGGLASKIFPFNSNKRSGLRIELGAYYLRHWVNMKTEFGIIPQLEGDYKKGYDHLTGGLSFKEFIGYQYLKKDSKINFYAGFEFIQGFTKSLREINYNTGVIDLQSRNDYLFGFKLGWILPIYIENNPDEIYY